MERVLGVIDDDLAVRESLTALFEANGFAVHAFSKPQHFLESEFLRASGSAELDCLVVDLRLPGMTGVELQRHLSEREVDFPVIVITAFGEVRAAVEALKLGAEDFIEKPFDDDVLVTAVENAITRAETIRERTLQRRRAAERLATLSQREREILAQVAAGAPSKVIAHNLGISRRTVEIHRTNIMRKVNAQNLVELVGLAYQANYEPDSS